MTVSCDNCGATLQKEEIQYCDGLCLECYDEEEDFLTGVSCNPDAPEECESCQ